MDCCLWMGGAESLWASKSGTRGRASTTSPPGRWSESSEAEDLEHYNTILSFIEELSQWDLLEISSCTPSSHLWGNNLVVDGNLLRVQLVAVMIMMILGSSFPLFARCRSKCFRIMNSFNPHSHPVMRVLLPFLLYR